MDFTNQDDSSSSKCLNSLLIGIVGSIIGGIFVYWMLKEKGNNIGIAGGQQYHNSEMWHPVRDISGHIVDLHISGNAQISDENRSSTVYKSLEQSPGFIEYSPQTNMVSNKINVDQLTELVQQRLDRRYRALNKKTTDYERQRRFGMV